MQEINSTFLYMTRLLKKKTLDKSRYALNGRSAIINRGPADVAQADDDDVGEENEMWRMKTRYRDNFGQRLFLRNI